MDTDPHIKIQPPVHEAVHVCRKCGWMFPNAHPSARHRRAHKKICGTIEGYKLVASNGSDAGGHSDEDCKPPSPRVMESSVDEKGYGAIVERSDKSDDEVFADAATEFSDSSGFSPGVEELFVDAKKSNFNSERAADGDSGSVQSVKDDAVTDIIQPSSSSTNNVPTVGSIVNCVSDHVKESHIVLTNDSNGVSPDSYLIEKPDDDAAQEIEANLDESMIESSSKVMIKHGAIEVTDIAPELEKMNEQDVVPADEALYPYKEESIVDLNPEILASVSSFDNTRTNVKVAQSTGSVISSYVLEGRDGKEENESVHLLSAPDDTLVLTHPEVILDRLVPLDSCERIEDNSSSSQSKQLEDSSMSSSVMPVLEEKPDDESFKSAVKEVPSEGEVGLPEVTITVDKNDQSDEGVPACVRTEGDGPRYISKDSSDVAAEILSDVNVSDSSIEAKLNEPANSVDMKEAVGYEKGTNENSDAVETEFSEGVVDNSMVNIEKAHESSCSSAGCQVNSTIDSSKDNNAGSQEHGKSEKSDTSKEGVSISTNSVPAVSINKESLSGGPAEENVLIMTKPVPVFSSNLHESNDKVPDIGDSSRDCTEVPNIQECTDKKINGCVDGMGVPTKSANKNVTEHHIMKEQLVSPQSSTAVEENEMEETVELTSTIGTSETLQAEADNNTAKQNFSAADMSIDSFSQTDSLDAHWGSVSVLSTQSDLQNLKIESSDGYDPPSFLTLVENGATGEETVLDSKMKADENAQQSMQAGWFPSLTNVVNESPGRKKNEEIIAKVTSWSSEGKQHIPLKTLISEAKENPAAMAREDGAAGKENGGKTTTVNSILGMESPACEGSAEQVPRGWSSPARYPAEIKGGKRKVKGRPMWAQFVCCSSVN